VNNAIEHAYWGAAGHFVEVVVRVDERALTFEVGDTGEPMNWREVLAAIEDATDVRREGNRGLSIILSCMDSVSYHSEPGKNVLAFAKHLPPGTPESLDRLT
jgi:anti-sigma regulatory factor (Ser/Thr protein kinase)